MKPITVINSIISFLLLIPTGLYTQVTYEFIQFGDTLSNNRGACLLPDEFDNVLFIGTVSDGTGGSDDVSVSKINADGNILWSYAYGADNNEYANNCVGYDNQYLFICGNIKDAVLGTTDALLLKMDTAGNLIWLQTFGENLINEDFIGITLLSDGNIAVTGFVSAEVGSGNDVLTVVYNQSGELQNSFVFGSTNNDYGLAILETHGGDLIIAGDRAIEASDYNPFYARVSRVGDIQFDNIFNLPENSGCKSMHFNSVDNLVFSGETASPVDAVFDMFMAEADTNGNIIFVSSFPGIGPEAGYDIAQASDSTYIITGFGFNPDTDENDIVAVQTDLSGNFLNRKFYGADGADLAYDIKMDANGSYWLAGFTTVGDNVMFGLIYDSFQPELSIQNETSIAVINIYPQPASGFITINSNLPFSKIEIMDLSRRMVKSIQVPYTNTTIINEIIESGMYVLKLYHPNGTISTQLIAY